MRRCCSPQSCCSGSFRRAHALTSAPLLLGAVAIGALVFFVSEYTTHRFMLHAPPSGNAFV